MGALSGLRVVDLSSGIAGPMAAMHLADFGADVVKVEGADGDLGRHHPGFAMWNRNKAGIVADLATSDGADRIAALLDGADVCVVSVPVARMTGTVLDTAAATERNPRLVYLHTPPYLDSAPWCGERESASLLGASVGIARRQASFEDVPVDSVYPHVLYAQAAWGAACAVAALVERDESGLGQVVTVGGVHGAMVTSPGMFSIDPDAVAVRRGAGGAGGSVPFYRTYRCGDGGWLFLAALTPNFYLPAFEALGVSDMIQDPRVGGRPGGLLKPENISWVIERMAAVFATKPRDEWLDVLDAIGVPAGPVLDRDDWLDHPQVRSIAMRVEIDDPDRGTVVMPGISLVLTRTPGDVRSPAPRLGEHDARDDTTVDSRRDHGRQTSKIATRTGGGPLAGMRVLDLGAIIAGPYAASLLGELGADVIKVEPLGGESFRGPNSSPYNKGQRGLAIDLRAEKGRAAFLRLVEQSDVVVDNYRPGVLQRLGIAYDDLRAVNARIVTLSITGFGEGGPLGDKPGFDPVLQAMSGMMRAQGGDHDPVFFTMPVDDVGTAALSAFAACAALYERTQSGKGQRTWTSLAGTSCVMQAEELISFEGRPPSGRGGRDFPGPSDGDRFYAVADGWVRVQCDEPRRPELDKIATMARDDALALLAEAGIAAAAARVPGELALDQTLLADKVLHEVKDDDGRLRFTAGRFARFSRTEREGVLLSPGLGEHTREVLTGAGFTTNEVDDLLSSGVVGVPQE